MISEREKSRIIEELTPQAQKLSQKMRDYPDLTIINERWVALQVFRVFVSFGILETRLNQIIRVGLLEEYSAENIANDNNVTEDILNSLSFKHKIKLVKSIAKSMVPQKINLKDIERCSEIRNIFAHSLYIPDVDSEIGIKLTLLHKNNKEEIETFYDEFCDRANKSNREIDMIHEALNLPLTEDFKKE